MMAGTISRLVPLAAMVFAAPYVIVKRTHRRSARSEGYRRMGVGITHHH